MKKHLLSISFLFLLSFGSTFLFAQEVKKVAASSGSEQKKISAPAPASEPCSSCPKTNIQIAFPPIPVMQNTGNPEKDAADYQVKKEKWAVEVLALYMEKLNPAEKDKLRELLKKEKPEDILRGKVFISKNELQGK